MTLRIIGGTHRGRTLRSVPGRRTRPTSAQVRKALFDIARDLAGKAVLDLFAGTGAIALEALSRGAGRVVAVESDPRALATIRENALALGLAEHLKLVAGDALRVLAQPAADRGPFALVYADPPYAFEQWERLCALAAPLLAPEGLLAVEHSADTQITPPLALASPRDHRYGGSVISVMKPVAPG